MSIPGVDYAWSKPSIKALKAAGEVFVAQYFSPDQSKNLTPARSKDLLAAGIKIVVVWEYTAGAMKGGRAQGVKDAQNAHTEAKACGIGDIPIYFACDYDAPMRDQGEINAYFDGAASVLGDDRGRNGYGGFWPMSRAKADKKVHRIWGTPAWSGNNWATCGWRPDIMQGGYVHIGGVTCDLDAALHNDYGQWPRPKEKKTWQAWETKGHSSLEDVAKAVNMHPSTVLRMTSRHFGYFDPVVADYVDDVFAGRKTWQHNIPSGGTLWVLC